MLGLTDAVRSQVLVVDLDGTLIRSDLLIETAFSALGHNPRSILPILSAFGRGKAQLKQCIADEVKNFDPATLPYDPAVLTLIRDEKAAGRRVYLASASNERLVKAVADHLQLFDGWFGSSATENLSGSAKSRLLVERFGEQGFDYVGNDAVDLKVWPQASRAISIRAPGAVRRELDARHTSAVHLEHEKTGLKPWLKLLRIHQYAKNALVFLALGTSHSFNPQSALLCLLAFVAFSLCASAVYVLNDLVDIGSDRLHPSKKRRPLASGTVSLARAIMAIPILLVAGFGVALTVSPLFAGVVLGYLALTTAYSFSLKRKMMLDVVVLASLYTARVLGGAVAIQVPVSQWLIAFAMFIFTALALVKRYIEMTARLDASLPDASNRNYRNDDIDVVMAMAAAAGFNAVTVLALYINSDAVGPLYKRPELLWLVCPLLMYWIGRLLILAHRRMVDDDPIVFALRDPISRWVILSILIVAAVAI
ncbi:UbiA family prenyltransferase [Sphingomonas sp. AP4-R1]|uniref:UbiA family prenyltransferase n=1 Tax=Sphingomonas sp. AP4-R1 TaxID=2735134 RepID=UPI0014934654|nr:UbiA family prenyltransferase [Sphingomonas sp. AP4-R1]QJU56385.1 UbiA family prenyltransferase [Sphingomonas sp. AP4-R1]